MTTHSIQRHLLVHAGVEVHQLEECHVYDDYFQPFETTHGEDDYLIAIGIKGEVCWRHEENQCLLHPQQIVSFRPAKNLQIRRCSPKPALVLVWQFNMKSMRKANQALGGNGDADCPRKTWPLMGPLPLNDEQQLLVLSLRSAPDPYHHTLWYGAKLLELFATLPLSSTPGQAVTPHIHPAIQHTIAALHSNVAEPPSLPEIAKKAGVSSTHLSHLFTRQTGMTISRYLRQLRMQKAALLLKSGEYNVTETAFSVGYSSLGQFNQAFRETYGHTPGQHKRQQRVSAEVQPTTISSKKNVSSRKRIHPSL